MKDLNYYKNNAEEDYITTPISVLRYITELEKEVQTKQLAIQGVVSSKINKKTIGFWVMITSLVSMLLLLLVFEDKQLFAVTYLPFVIGLLMYRH